MRNSAVDFSSGKEINTGNPYDLAILGDGFFSVRSGDRILYTRQGQFQRDNEGRLVLPQGFALQTQSGGDLVLKSQDVKVLADGTVLERGEPVARLAVVDFEDRHALAPAVGGLFSASADAARPLDAPSVRQGELESSNVSTGDEMITIMEALRRAESAQRVVNIYDDLMGRALTSFGQP